MLSLTQPQLLQLSQLRKHNPTLFTDVENRLSQLPDTYSPKAAGKIIGQGMHRLAQLLEQPQKSQVEPAPDPAIPPPPGQILYDLIIASKKYGVGTTTSADDPISWWKVTGQPVKKFKTGSKLSIVDPKIQKRLQNYELVDTEVRQNQIIRKYRKLENV